MDTVDAIGLVSFQKMDQVSRAADTGYHHVVLHRLTGFFFTANHCEFHGPTDSKIPATGAPFKIVLGVLLTHTFTASFRRALVISVIFSTNVRALKGSPVYWVMDSALTPMERNMLENCPW